MKVMCEELQDPEGKGLHQAQEDSDGRRSEEEFARIERGGNSHLLGAAEAKEPCMVPSQPCCDGIP